MRGGGSDIFDCCRRHSYGTGYDGDVGALFLTDPLPMCSVRTLRDWRARLDSNQRPAASEAATLSI
jgi:hypothetical protein